MKPEGFFDFIGLLSYFIIFFGIVLIGVGIFHGHSVGLIGLLIGIPLLIIGIKINKEFD
jgi:hypothetical protein